MLGDRRSGRQRTKMGNSTIIGRWLRRAGPWVLAAAVVGLIALQLGNRAVLRRGTQAPALRTSLVGGAEFDVEQRSGRVTVLNFWASWCPPCRAEAPVLSRAHARLRTQNGDVIGLSVENMPLDAAGNIAQRLGMRYPVGVAPADTARTYRVEQLPTTYVIDGRGQITDTFVGAVSDRSLEAAIDDALAASSSPD